MAGSASGTTMGRREWAMLLVLASVRDGAFFFNGAAARELPTLTMVWLRAAIGSMVLLHANGEAAATAGSPM